MTTIKEKRRITRLLENEDLATTLATLQQMPAAGLIAPLFAGLCHTSENIRWHAITAMGLTVARLANYDMEGCRVIMRRLMWSLNDESGGIGWGAPEAMAEIIVQHDGLAAEYGHMPVAYMREDGFFLELPALQRGLMWGLARIAQTRRQLLQEFKAGDYLPWYLDSGDSEVLGLAIRTIGLLKEERQATRIRSFIGDHRTVRYFSDLGMVESSVGELAEEAVSSIEQATAQPQTTTTG